MLKKREWLSKAREDKGLTKTELAKRIKVVKSYISALENGDKNPSGKVALKLSYVLDVPMEKFFESEINEEEREELLLAK